MAEGATEYTKEMLRDIQNRVWEQQLISDRQRGVDTRKRYSPFADWETSNYPEIQQAVNVGTSGLGAYIASQNIASQNPDITGSQLYQQQLLAEGDLLNWNSAISAVNAAMGFFNPFKDDSTTGQILEWTPRVQSALNWYAGNQLADAVAKLPAGITIDQMNTIVANPTASADILGNIPTDSQLASAKAGATAGQLGQVAGAIGAGLGAYNISQQGPNIGNVASTIGGLGKMAGTSLMTAGLSSALMGVGAIYSLAQLSSMIGKKKLHAGEYTIGNTIQSVLEQGIAGNTPMADPEIALAYARLANPDSGGDSTGDAFNELVGRNILPGTSYARSDDIDRHTMVGFNKMISLGLISPEALNKALDKDLALFKNPEFLQKLNLNPIGTGVTFGGGELQAQANEGMVRSFQGRMRQKANTQMVDQLQSQYNAFIDKGNIDRITNEVQNALREGGRGDVRFNAGALRPINIGGDDEGSNVITSPDQYIAAVRNQIARAFLVNDGNDDLPMNPQAIEGLMRRIPSLRTVFAPLINPSKPTIQPFTPIDPNVIKGDVQQDQPVEEVDPVQQKLIQNVTESVTAFADAGKRGEQRPTGLLGVGSAPQGGMQQDKFMEEYGGNPLAMKILAEETGKAGPPFTNPSSPWYDPVRASEYNYTYHSREVGSGKARERLREMMVELNQKAKPLEAAVPQPQPQPQPSQEATGGIFSPSQAEEYRQEEVVQRMQEKASHTGSFGSSVFGINEIPQDIFSRLNVHAQKRLREGGKLPLNLAYYGY